MLMRFPFQIILKFHICYYDDDGSYISDYKMVSRSYMTRKVGYIYDVLCSFPYAFTVLHLMDTMETDSFLHLIVYARTAHVFRILTVLVFMHNEEQSITTKYVHSISPWYIVSTAVFTSSL